MQVKVHMQGHAMGQFTQGYQIHKTAKLTARPQSLIFAYAFTYATLQNCKFS